MSVLTLGCVGSAAEKAAKTPLPRVFSMNPKALISLHDRIASGNFSDPAIDHLRAESDKLLTMGPVSVMQKSVAPPSGDKHDYLSLAPYWWPDPTRPDGLPYIRRDGEVNPEAKEVQDHRHCDEMITATHRLALAYYLLGDEKYAVKATELLRTWFLDRATRMNPNMQFAQAVRGRNEGRGTGLIETRRLSLTVDAIGLLAGSKSWTEADQQGMQAWFSAFLQWLQESKNGRDESQAKNNHGTYYDVQFAAVALFTGKDDLAAKILKDESKRIAAQIDKRGGQPLELERTKALGYSTMNLAGLFQLASLGENVGIDLWSFQTSDGRSIRKALDFLTPFVTGEKKWPYQQIIDYQNREISPLLVIASVKYQDATYEQTAQKIDLDISKEVESLIVKFERKNWTVVQTGRK